MFFFVLCNTINDAHTINGGHFLASPFAHLFCVRTAQPIGRHAFSSVGRHFFRLQSAKNCGYRSERIAGISTEVKAGPKQFISNHGSRETLWETSEKHIFNRISEAAGYIIGGEGVELIFKLSSLFVWNHVESSKDELLALGNIEVGFLSLLNPRAKFLKLGLNNLDVFNVSHVVMEYRQCL